MDSLDSLSDKQSTEILFKVVEVEESSEDPPIEEWSSLEIKQVEINAKKILYQEGLYEPGSGEICTKYVCLSASSVLAHPYYNYPAVLDPGIEKALLEREDEYTYPDDGQEIYLATCKEMNQCPVRLFYRGLLEDKIDLKYYCVDPNGVRAMTYALRHNDNVQVFDLTDNFLNDDACYHLGEMLRSNKRLVELNLNGCRIGPYGVKLLLRHLTSNTSLKTLNLSRNQLGDPGMEHIGNSIFFGLDIKNLNLSHNRITGKGAVVLAQALEIQNRLTHLDMSWNQLFYPGTAEFLNRLSESMGLQFLDLSWNGLSGNRVALALKQVLLCPLLRTLNLNNNKFGGESMNIILESLSRAKKLVTLNISYNPLNPQDSYNVLKKLRSGLVRVKNVYMDNIDVNTKFMDLLAHMKVSRSKKHLVVTHGHVRGDFVAKGPDPRDLVLNRIEYLTKKSKKNAVDIALIVQQLIKENVEIVNVKEFGGVLTRLGAKLDGDLVDELANAFPGPRTAKNRTVNIPKIVDFTKRKWPDRKLPPTPPPEPEPEPLPKQPVKKGKGKK